VWVRWPARMRGAIMPCLIFLSADRQVCFFFYQCLSRKREKKERQPLAVSKYTYNTLAAYSTQNIFVLS
jgi:hypothetical protein